VGGAVAAAFAGRWVHLVLFVAACRHFPRWSLRTIIPPYEQLLIAAVVGAIPR
jgi:hypothetical protein